jgi:2-methylcitrate dehydratase PrpD
MGSNVTTPMLNNVGYRPDSFDPIAIVGAPSFIFVVDSRSSIGSMQELVGEAKKRSLTYGSAGAGSSTYVALALFSRRVGIEMLHIPFNGSAEALTAVLGRHVDLALPTTGSGLPSIRQGAVRGLAITSSERSKEEPSIPTVKETGVDFTFYNWRGILAPKGTPRDLVTGYIVGLEVIGKLGAALNMDHYSRGWHATSTFGSLAATAAACCALGLNEEATAVALAIGASSACGVRANFGTMTKPLHAGFAARNGVAAALLARAGWTANPTAIEHPAGYIAAFNAGGTVQAEPLLRWGEELEILSEFGLQLKPYPACGATHPGTEAALLAHEQIGPEGWRMVEDVRMGVSEYTFKSLIYKRPETGLQGKFSLHHCVASALVRGRVDLSSFTDECVADPRIAELTGRVRVEADDRVRHDPEYATHLEIRLKDGRRVETFVPLALGKPSRWLSKAVLRAKFEDCVRHSGAKDAVAVTNALFEASQGIDTDVPASVLDEMACAARQGCDLAVRA